MIDNYIKELKEVLDKIDRNRIESLVNKIVVASKNRKNVFIVGNGGSAANASHLACDLGKGTLKRYYDKNQKRIRVTSLTDNVAAITCLANDLAYEEIFSQQLRNLINSEDLLIVITGSGNSRNILNAIDVAKRENAYVFALLGFDGGEALSMADESIIVPSNNYGIIEDTHMAIGHMITAMFKEKENAISFIANPNNI